MAKAAKVPKQRLVLDPDGQKRLETVIQKIHGIKGRIARVVKEVLADVCDPARYVYLTNELTRRAKRTCIPAHVAQAKADGDKAALSAMGRKGGLVTAQRRRKARSRENNTLLPLFQEGPRVFTVQSPLF